MLCKRCTFLQKFAVKVQLLISLHKFAKKIFMHNCLKAQHLQQFKQ